MKTIVSMQELRELEIKPSKLLTEYRSLLEGEVRALWKSRLAVKLERCPACGGKLEKAFEKWGVNYDKCGGCSSLFAATRPDEDGLGRFYAHSHAAAFWRDQVLETTEAARMEKLLVPRCEWVLAGLAEYLPNAATALDHTPFGAPLLRLMAEQLASLESIIAAHPLSGAGTSHSKAISSPGALYAKPEPKVDFILAFDSLDRASDPKKFVAALRACLNPEGITFLTATSSSGLEIQVLGSRSTSILPPDRLNLFSIEGLQALFPEKEWETCEISTPGMFDVEVVKGHLRPEDAAGAGVFFDYVIRQRGPECLDALQEFLQQNRLSSFARLIVRKR